MINNRHGPHPAVSYYRSGAPPGCGLEIKNGASCELRVAPRDSYGVKVRGKPGPHRIRDDDFVNSLSERNQHKKENSYPRSFGKDTEKILCIQPFAALGDSLARFAVSKRKERREDAKNAERILDVVNNAYELMMT